MFQKSSLLLIPSQLCTGLIWQRQVEAVADLCDTAVADNAAGDSMTGIAAHILRSAPKRFSLAAHGMGGFVAFEIMRQQPDRVEKLALFDTLAEADTPAQTSRREGYAQMVRDGQFEEVIETRIPILFHPEHQADEKLLGIARQMAAETGPDAFLRQQAAIMTRPDSRPMLSSIRCPTLVAVGEADAIVSIQQAQEMAGLIPRSEFHILGGCGHFTLLEDPKTTSDLLKNWLQG